MWLVQNVVLYDEKLLLPLLIEVAKLLMHVSIEEVEDLQSLVHAKNMFHTTTTIANIYKDLFLREPIGFYWYPIDIISSMFYLNGAKNKTSL